MNFTRPINEELTRLHQPVVVEDTDSSALDGFTVTNSGSAMVPTGSAPPLFMQSSNSTVSTSPSSTPSTVHTDPYHSTFAGYSISPGYASDPYSAAHQAHSYPRHAHAQSLHHYSQQQQQQQMQMAQAYRMNYGHAASWSQV